MDGQTHVKQSYHPDSTVFIRAFDIRICRSRRQYIGELHSFDLFTTCFLLVSLMKRPLPPRSATINEDMKSPACPSQMPLLLPSSWVVFKWPLLSLSWKVNELSTLRLGYCLFGKWCFNLSAYKKSDGELALASEL